MCSNDERIWVRRHVIELIKRNRNGWKRENQRWEQSGQGREDCGLEQAGWASEIGWIWWNRNGYNFWNCDLVTHNSKRTKKGRRMASFCAVCTVCMMHVRRSLARTIAHRMGRLCVLWLAEKGNSNSSGNRNATWSEKKNESTEKRFGENNREAKEVVANKAYESGERTSRSSDLRRFDKKPKKKPNKKTIYRDF